jgi:hypothetical protein
MILWKWEERAMGQNATDQGWQELQANIERFLGQSLQCDGRRVEYKPRFIATLSAKSTDYPQMEGASPDSRKSASRKETATLLYEVG